MKDFIEFASSIIGGLAKATTNDVNVFLLATTGVLLSTRRTRGMGLALGAYVTFRRLDTYVDVLHSDARLLAQVMEATASPPVVISQG